MQRHIEFHDSKIIAVTQNGSVIYLSVEAYVHQWERIGSRWKGTGWTQPIRISITGVKPTKTIKLPVRLDGGEIRTDTATYDNIVPLPFKSSEPTLLRLEAVEIIEISGQDISIETTGPARYVEELPDEFKPREDDPIASP